MRTARKYVAGRIESYLWRSRKPGLKLFDARINKECTHQSNEGETYGSRSRLFNHWAVAQTENSSASLCFDSYTKHCTANMQLKKCSPWGVKNIYSQHTLVHLLRAQHAVVHLHRHPNGSSGILFWSITGVTWMYHGLHIDWKGGWRPRHLYSTSMWST